MLNIYICDSNEKLRKDTEKIMTELFEKHNIQAGIVLSTANPEEIIKKAYQFNDNNIYILDTNFESSINGFALAKKIREFDIEGYIIFLTSHIELMMMTFEYKVRSLDYISKDDNNKIKNRLEECLLKCDYEIHNMKRSVNTNILKVKVGSKLITIDQRNIEYIETIDSNHKIRIKTVMKEIEAYGVLKDLEKQLDKNTFVRCHRSYIANLNQIAEIDKSKYIATTKSGSSFYISKSYMKDILLKINKI
ncbi:response regulator transcription factor [Clostridium sp. YIM B02505]|uniref:Stage 0 sporulation protein A homolog n=1 Tax=Clostridium yunnanense TaxID=2800325 RepID=A0ABS1EL48_9CLOT|nr:LytTR family DNA-binding domain-containing protein [Clostridium yunnanense]MBK1810072.1 response regulator transcription factor [Clostridium yunnanense]